MKPLPTVEYVLSPKNAAFLVIVQLISSKLRASLTQKASGGSTTSLQAWVMAAHDVCSSVSKSVLLEGTYTQHSCLNRSQKVPATTMRLRKNSAWRDERLV